MIISHDYKFIFIKTRKTAGSSIEKVLLDNLQETDYIFSGMPPENMDPVGIESGHEHKGCYFIKEKFPKEWKNYFKFTIERNSWDKVVSLYYYRKKVKPKQVKNGFENFVKSEKRCFLNDWNLYTEDDNLVVDKIIDYNCLNQEFSNICNFLSIPYNNELSSTVKLKGNLRDNKNYKEMYNLETKTIVQNFYNKPISYFKFNF